MLHPQLGISSSWMLNSTFLVHSPSFFPNPLTTLIQPSWSIHFHFFPILSPHFYWLSFGSCSFLWAHRIKLVTLLILSYSQSQVIYAFSCGESGWLGVKYQFTYLLLWWVSLVCPKHVLTVIVHCYSVSRTHTCDRWSGFDVVTVN